MRSENGTLKQIGHLIGYDVRALKLPLALWGLVLATEGALLVAGPRRLGFDPGQAPFDLVVLVLRLALTPVLVALVVQRDALVGTTVFWRTWPVPRPRLLASKIATVGLGVVVIPWLVMFAVLVGLSVPAAAAARGALSVAAEQALLAVLALAAAALTANLAHFVLVSFGGVAVVMAFLATLRVVALRGTMYVQVAAGWASGVFVAIAAVGAVAVAVHQFLTLRTGRSTTVLAGMFGLALVGGALWHPMPTERDTRPVDPSWMNPAAVSVRVSELQWRPWWSSEGGVRRQERVLTAVLTTSGEPEAVLLTFDSLDVALSFGGRRVAERSYHVRGGSAGRTAQPFDQPYRSIRAALGDTELVLRPNTYATKAWVELTLMPKDLAPDLPVGDGTLEGSVGLRAFRYVVTARTGLAVGQTLTTASHHSTIVTIGPVVRIPPVPGPPRPGVDITLRSTVVGLTPWIGLPLPPTGFFLLRNEARRESVFLTPWGANQLTPVAGLTRTNVTRVWTGSQRLEFDAVQRDTPFPFDDEWLRGAELLLIQPEALGVVTRPLHVDGVPTPSEAGRQKQEVRREK